MALTCLVVEVSGTAAQMQTALAATLVTANIASETVVEITLVSPQTNNQTVKVIIWYDLG